MSGLPELALSRAPDRWAFLVEESDGNLGEIAILREKIEEVAYEAKRG